MPRPRPRRFLTTLAAAAALTALDSPQTRAAPGDATYSRDSSRLFWLLHLSDSHIGASAIEGPNASAHLEWALSDGIDVIDPERVIVTGDLCDGSRYSIPASGQEQGEWDEYAGLYGDAGMTADFFVDLPGNHDGYGDPGLTYYLANSLQGQDEGVPYHSLWLTFPFGDYLIYGLDTAGNGSNAFVEAPAFLADDVQHLQDMLATTPTPNLVLLFGHHRLTTPDNADAVIALAQQAEAFYFHGHVHAYGSYLTEGLVAAQVDTLGKGNSNNVAVIAVDNDAVSYGATSTAAPWPFIVITAPANRVLDSDEVNPWAYSVCNTGEKNPVRALVFDEVAVTAVSFDDGDSSGIPMVQDSAEPRLWHGSWDTRGLPTGERTLTVTATGTETRSAEVTVLLEDVGCPPELPTGPDAGVGSDAGPTADASLTADASPAGSDGGGPGLSPHGGCGCRTDGPGPVAPPLLGVWLAWLVVRRRAA